jgi:hypothetical protein
MPLPLKASWEYMNIPEPGSREAVLSEVLSSKVPVLFCTVYTLKSEIELFSV